MNECDFTMLQRSHRDRYNDPNFTLFHYNTNSKRHKAAVLSNFRRISSVRRPCHQTSDDEIRDGGPGRLIDAPRQECSDPITHSAGGLSISVTAAQ